MHPVCLLLVSPRSVGLGSLDGFEADLPGPGGAGIPITAPARRIPNQRRFRRGRRTVTVVMMVWRTRGLILATGATITSTTTIGSGTRATAAGGRNVVAGDHLVTIHHQPQSIASSGPRLEEGELVDHADQRGFVLHIRIAGTAGRTSREAGGIEDEVTQEVVLDHSRHGIGVLVQAGFESHLLRHGDLIRGQRTERGMTTPADVIDRPAQGLSDLTDEANTAKRDFGLQNQFTGSRTVGSQDQFEFQNKHFLS